MGRRMENGFSLMEMTMVMGIVALLSLTGVHYLDASGLELMGVQEELRGSIHQAFILAHAQGSNVIVALGEPGQPGVLPVALPGRVKWGKPSSIPVPPGMTEPKVAGTTGQAHARITVTPRHTATASAWFLTDGRGAICMRLSGRGHLQMLRWSPLRGKWMLV